MKIQAVVVPPTLRVSKEKYTKTTDPIDYIACFKSMLDLYDATDAIKCKMFSTTLIEMAHSWYESLPTQLIICFKQFKILFIGHFLVNKKQTQKLASMWSISQGPSGSLKAYTKRFTAAYANISDLNENFTIEAFKVRFLNENVYYAFCDSDIVGMQGIATKAQVLAEAEKIRVSRSSRTQTQE